MKALRRGTLGSKATHQVWHGKYRPVHHLASIGSATLCSLATILIGFPSLSEDSVRNAPLESAVERSRTAIELLGIDPSSALGTALARAAAVAEREIPLRIGLPLPERVRVVFCPDARSFAQWSRHPMSSSLLGAAHPEEGLVVLNGPLIGPDPEASPIRILRHELAHLALGGVEGSSGPLPRWFDEGVASWFAGGFAELGPLDLAPAAARGRLSLRRLKHGFPEEPDRRRIAYVKSQLAIELLERERGPNAVAAIGRALAAGVPFSPALEAVAGLDEDGLDRALQRATAPHGLFLAVLRRSLSPVLVMSSLALLGFMLRKARARRRLRQWEREEEGRGEGGEG